MNRRKFNAVGVLCTLTFLFLEISQSAFAYDVAPYFYTWGYNSTSYKVKSLVEAKQKAQLNAATLAFVLSAGGCSITSDVDNMISDVQAFVSSGGRLTISFGGADGTYLEDGCQDVHQIVNLITDLMARTGTYKLD